MIFRTLPREGKHYASLVRPGRADALVAGPFATKAEAAATAAALASLCNGNEPQAPAPPPKTRAESLPLFPNAGDEREQVDR